MPAPDHIHVLVVDPDAPFRAAVRRTLSKLAVVDEAGSHQEAALALSRNASYGAFIVEAAVPDGSGLDWLASARLSHGSVPCLVVTSSLDRVLVNRVFALDARLHCKPIPFRVLQSFVRDAAGRLLSAGKSAEGIEACVRQWGVRLTPTEARIVQRAVVHRGERRQIANELGLSENTVKTHVRSALRKLGAESLGSCGGERAGGDEAVNRTGP